MTRVLLVEDSRTQSLQIQMLLQDAKFEVSTARHGGEALTQLGASGATPPDVVLTDLEMPHLNGLELVEAMRRNHPGIPVVLMTALGSEEIAVRALQAGAASYVAKKNLARDIGATLEGVVAVAQSRQRQQRLLECLEQTEARFVLDNDSALVSPLLGHLESLSVSLQLAHQTDRLRVGVALHEAVLNAMYHGNLEISSDFRQVDEARFYDLVAARRRQSPYRERRVHVLARLSRSQVIFVVRDEGPGFDISALPDPTDPGNLDRVGGRGLMLIRTFMDEVTHNTIGNQITMVKIFAGACRDEG